MLEGTNLNNLILSYYYRGWSWLQIWVLKGGVCLNFLLFNVNSQSWSIYSFCIQTVIFQIFWITNPNLHTPLQFPYKYTWPRHDRSRRSTTDAHTGESHQAQGGPLPIGSYTLAARKMVSGHVGKVQMAVQVTSFKGKMPEILPGGNFGSTTLCTFRSLCHLAEKSETV